MSLRGLSDTKEGLVLPTRAGSEVYELVDPAGRVYAMLSYSHQVDDTLTEADLPGLGSRLPLPAGWGFRARVVSADYVVEDQAGVATVVQDELRNTYQLVVPTPVEIDVRPRSARNKILACDRCVIPVAVLGSETMDAALVDPGSLAFGTDGAAPLLTTVFDLNHDGSEDLLALFFYGDTGLALGEGAVCLTGLVDGTEFEGCDSVTVVMRGCGLGFELALLLPAVAWSAGDAPLSRRHPIARSSALAALAQVSATSPTPARSAAERRPLSSVASGSPSLSASSR